MAYLLLLVALVTVYWDDGKSMNMLQEHEQLYKEGSLSLFQPIGWQYYIQLQT